MIVTVRDPSILSNLDPMQITAYLQSRGWLQESGVDDKESVWVISINDEFSITLPLNPKTRSYALRMAEILDTLERAEGRSQLDIRQRFSYEYSEFRNPRVSNSITRT